MLKMDTYEDYAHTFMTCECDVNTWRKCKLHFVFTSIQFSLKENRS